MNSLDLSKVSAVMTPKERAKLVISLQLKGLTEISDEEVAKYMDGEMLINKDLPNLADVNDVIFACPPQEAKEYNFFIHLKTLIWQSVVNKISHNLARLDILDGNLAVLNYLISIAPLVLQAVDELSKIPSGAGRALDLLTALSPFQISNRNLQEYKITLKFSLPEYEEMILFYVTQASKLIQNTFNCLAVIKKVEEKYFDGMNLFSENLSNSDFAVEKAEKSIKAIIDTYNGRIEEVIELFDRIGPGIGDFELENMEQYLLPTEYEEDQEWITRQLAILEAEARK